MESDLSRKALRRSRDREQVPWTRQPFCFSQDCLRNCLSPQSGLRLGWLCSSSCDPHLCHVPLAQPFNSILAASLHLQLLWKQSTLITVGAPYWVRGAKYSQVSGDHLPQEQLPLRAVERPHLETNIVFLENCPFSRVSKLMAVASGIIM